MVSRVTRAPAGDEARPKGAPFQLRVMVHTAAFSPDGNMVVAGTDDHIAQFWDARTGQPKGRLLKHQGAVIAVAFNPDGSRVITGTSLGVAQLWDTQSGQPKGAPLLHQETVKVVAFGPDGKTVLTGGYDHTARLWDVATIEGRGESVEKALTGTPAEVLERWLKRTALQFGPDGVMLIPRYPLPEPPKENPEPRVP